MQHITKADFLMAALSFSPVIDISAHKVYMTGTRLIQPTLDTFLSNCITEPTSVTRRDIRAMDRSFRRLRECKAFISSSCQIHQAIAPEVIKVDPGLFLMDRGEIHAVVSSPA